MTKRGPKLRTSRNSPRGTFGAIHRDKVEPTSTLNANATGEFFRLVEVLESRGTLDRVDLAVLTEAARIKDLLDRAHGLMTIGVDSKMVPVLTALTAQRRGLLREMSLTTIPSRSVVRTVAGSGSGPQNNAVANYLKLKP